MATPRKPRTSISPNQRKLIIDHIRQGVTPSVGAKAIGVDARRINHFVNRGKKIWEAVQSGERLVAELSPSEIEHYNFYGDVEKAGAEFELEALRKVKAGGKDAKYWWELLQRKREDWKKEPHAIKVDKTEKKTVGWLDLDDETPVKATEKDVQKLIDM